MNRMIELLFSQCNAYFINDVLTCFLYLEQWLQYIRANSIATTLHVKTNTPLNNVSLIESCDIESGNLSTAFFTALSSN